MSTWRERAPEIQALLDTGATNAEIALHYGVSKKSIRNRVGELSAAGLIKMPEQRKRSTPPTDDVDDVQREIEKFGVQREIDGKTLTHKSTRLLVLSETEDKDPDALLRGHNYDPAEWELIGSKSKIWHSYSKKDYVVTLYSSSITVRPRQTQMTPQELREFLIETSRSYIRPVPKPLPIKETGKLLEVNVADLHLGKLAWIGDSNDTYNEKIAEERFFYVINKVLSKTQNYEFERILFVFSNDFFHVDSEAKTTTSGTPQDTNLQYKQMFKLGVKMLVEAIDMLSQIAPVHTFYIGSNHDKLTSYYATEFLYAWYRNDPNVTVDADPKIRKYFEFGDCLIGFSHGHAEKNRLGKIMPVEAREAWGRTIYHEYHCGHWHTDKVVVEENGVIVRYLPSVTGTDNWHYESGFVGAVQKSQSFVWDRNEGVEQIINATVIGKKYGNQNVCLV